MVYLKEDFTRQFKALLNKLFQNKTQVSKVSFMVSKYYYKLDQIK